MNYRNLLITNCLLLITHLTFGQSLGSIPNSQFENWGNPLYSYDCPYEDYKERKKCSGENVIEFIHQNLVYPESAIENNIEGLVIITFMIKEDGTMSNFQILQEPDKTLGDEALRVIKLLPHKWETGKRDGYYILSGVMLPVQFTLEEEIPKETKKRKRKKRRQKKN